MDVRGRQHRQVLYSVAAGGLVDDDLLGGRRRGCGCNGAVKVPTAARSHHRVGQLQFRPAPNKLHPFPTVLSAAKGPGVSGPESDRAIFTYKVWAFTWVVRTHHPSLYTATVNVSKVNWQTMEQTRSRSMLLFRLRTAFMLYCPGRYFVLTCTMKKDASTLCRRGLTTVTNHILALPRSPRLHMKAWSFACSRLSGTPERRKGRNGLGRCRKPLLDIDSGTTAYDGATEMYKRMTLFESHTLPRDSHDDQFVTDRKDSRWSCSLTHVDRSFSSWRRLAMPKSTRPLAQMASHRDYAIIFSLPFLLHQEQQRLTHDSFPLNHSAEKNAVAFHDVADGVASQTL